MSLDIITEVGVRFLLVPGRLIRTFMRRFTRLAMGFSKKLENLRAACAIQIAYYNFCWRPREKKGGKLRPTPAMAAGVIDTLWTMDDLYDAVMERENEAKQRERYDRLIAKLTGAK